MYVATFIFFLIPWSNLGGHGQVLWRKDKEVVLWNWRSFCLRAAPIVATFATPTAMGLFFCRGLTLAEVLMVGLRPGLWLISRDELGLALLLFFSLFDDLSEFRHSRYVGRAQRVLVDIVPGRRPIQGSVEAAFIHHNHIFCRPNFRLWMRFCVLR